MEKKIRSCHNRRCVNNSANVLNRCNFIPDPSMCEDFIPKENDAWKEGVDNSVDHPKHYVSHPSNIECIQVTEHFNFNLGNAIKYIWRSDLKGKQVEDLEKAIWYIKRELKRLGEKL